MENHLTISIQKKFLLIHGTHLPEPKFTYN
jgi:hypothetical protein